MIKFSVIIPNYNHADFLKERIDSILGQTYQEFEIIILDDCSTDNSRSIIETYRQHPKIKYVVYNEANTGLQTVQWLKGIRLANHDWIWIAESDDIAEKAFLETAALEISSHQHPTVFYTDSFHMVSPEKNTNDPKSSILKKKYFKKPHWEINYSSGGITEINEYMKYVCTINNVSCCIVPKKEALEVLNDFPHMTFYNDWLFYIRMLELCPVLYSTSCLNWYRIHDKSHFNTPGKNTTKKKECFNILVHLYKASYITKKNKLVKFFTEQYLGMGLWKERKSVFPLFAFYLHRSPVIFLKFMAHLIYIKVTRKKNKYIF
jgi:glycosyltransferase involved in cell wall biosynthesis